LDRTKHSNRLLQTGGLRPDRRARRQTETRARILEAALGLFARQGFSATSVEQITEAADVGKGTFFNYFPSKEHVLAGFAGRQLEKIQGALNSARDNNQSVHDVLRRLLESLQQEPTRSPQLARSLLVGILSSEPVRELTYPPLERARSLLAELMALGQERGEIRSDVRPADLARFFQQNGFGAVLLWSFHPEQSVRELQRATFELIWSALQARLRSRRKEQWL
jgi:AcrR family transcriptional regulator